MDKLWILAIIGVIVLALVLGLVFGLKKEGYEATSDVSFNNFMIKNGSISINDNKVSINNLQISSKNKNRLVIKGSHPKFTFSGAEKKIPIQGSSPDLVMILKPNGDFEILKESDGKLDRIQLTDLTFSANFTL